jgi:hypothetical protein
MEFLFTDKLESCCGSFFSIFYPKQSLKFPFERYEVPITTFIDDISHDTRIFGIIDDLRVKTQNDSKTVTLFWTAPDLGNTEQKHIRYQIRYTVDLHNLIDNYDTLTNLWDNTEKILVHNTGHESTVHLSTESYPELIGKKFYMAIRIIDEHQKSLAMSNVVRAFLPVQKTNVVYTDQSESEIEIEPTSVESEENLIHGIAAKFKINQEILSLFMVLTFLVAFCVIIICCCIRRKHKTKKNETKLDQLKDTPSISIILPSHEENHYHEAFQNFYRVQNVGLPLAEIDETDKRHFFDYQSQSDYHNYNFANHNNQSNFYTASQLLKNYEYNDNSSLNTLPPIPPYPIGQLDGYNLSTCNVHDDDTKTCDHEIDKNYRQRQIRNITMV